MNADPKSDADWDGDERRDPPPAGGTSIKIIMSAVAVAAAVFALDIMAPLGVAGGAPYVALVLLGWWFQERLAVFLLAAAATALTVLGFFLSPEGGTGWVVLTNRAYAILGIWATATVLSLAWREHAYRLQLSMEEQRLGKKNRLSLGREVFFVSILMFVIVAASWGVLTRIEKEEKTNIGKSLKTVLETSHVSIRNQLDAQKKASMIWAENAQIRTAIMELMSLPLDAKTLIESRAQKNLRAWLKPVFRTAGYRGFFIIGNDNITRASSRDDDIGVVSILSRQGDFLDRVWAGETLISLPQISDVPFKDVTGENVDITDAMFVASPIKSAGDDVIAILAFRLEPDENFSPIFERARFGDSGETYAFNGKGLMISVSRFDATLKRIGLLTSKDSDLNVEVRDPGVNLVMGQPPPLPPGEWPPTRMARSAMAGERGSDLDGYRDYRGVPVVGAWLWDDELGFGIATEVDVEEAFAPFYNTRFVIIVFSALSIGVLVVLAVMFARAKRKISDAYEKNQLILNSVGEGIYGLDNRGRTTFVNPAARRMLGYDTEELIGRPSHSLIHHSYPDGTPYPREECHMQAVFADGNVRHIEDEVLWRKDGSSFPVEYTSTPICKNDKMSGAVVTFRDITERKETEAELRKLSRAVEQSPISVVITDENGIIEYVNPTFIKVTGYTFDEAIGKTPRILNSGTHSKEFYKELWNTISSGKTWSGEIKNRKKNGEALWESVSISPIKSGNGKITNFVGVKEEITQRKELEASLRKAKEEADKANQAKSDFLSSMSHELRTPMNAILGFGQMLEFNPKEPLTEAQKDCVNHIITGGRHLLDLINDVLDLAKVEAGKVEFSIEDISPGEVLTECLSLIAIMAEERGIGVSVPIASAQAPRIRADFTRFKQVLLNLMSNAVKYNRENGTVTVNFKETAGDMLRITVADTGKGIPEDRRDELFKPFNRLGAENTEIEGTGIGLVVCRDLTELMNGRIGFESEVGKGSAFWVELPLAERSHDEAAAIIVATAGQAETLLPGMNGRLLYVEDNPDNLKLMELIVSRIEGLSMISAHTGELGIELARGERPDIIILDINLPGMSGIEVLEKLRCYEDTKDIPVLALSAAATERNIKKGMEAGFLRYLTKPIQVVEVVDAIKIALEAGAE